MTMRIVVIHAVVIILCTSGARTIANCESSPVLSESASSTLTVDTVDSDTGARLSMVIEQGKDSTHHRVFHRADQSTSIEVANWTSTVSGIEVAAISAAVGRIAACAIASRYQEQEEEVSRDLLCWEQAGIGTEMTELVIAQGLVSKYILMFPSGDGWALWFQEQRLENAPALDVVRYEIENGARETFRLTSYKRADGLILCHPHPDLAVVGNVEGEWLLSHEYCVNTVSYERGYEVCLRLLDEGGDESFESCRSTGEGPFSNSSLELEDRFVIGCWRVGNKESCVQWPREHQHR